MGRTIRCEFDSLREFYAACDESFFGMYGNRPGFNGASDEKITATKYAWHEPFERREAGRGPGSSVVRNRWSDYDGDSMDMDRLHDGRPCLVRRIKAPGGCNGRVRTMHIDIGYNSTVDAEEIMSAARDRMSEIDALEAGGERVEAYIVIKTERSFRRSLHSPFVVNLKIRVKRADEPLNMEGVAAGMAPWFLRVWFGLFLHGEAGRRGLKVKADWGCSVKWEDVQDEK